MAKGRLPSAYKVPVLNNSYTVFYLNLTEFYSALTTLL